MFSLKYTQLAKALALVPVKVIISIVLLGSDSHLDFNAFNVWDVNAVVSDPEIDSIAEFNEERILYKEDLKPNNSWNGGVIYTNKAKRYSKGKK